MNSESQNPTESKLWALSCCDPVLRDGGVLLETNNGLQGTWSCSCKCCSGAVASQELVKGQANRVCNTEMKKSP